MRIIWLAVLGVLLAAVAHAQSAGAPKVAPGDTWTYRNTIEKGNSWQQVRDELTVVRASADSIEISNKVADSTMPPSEVLVGADWSRSRSVNGRQTVVNQPLSFPLSIGKNWTTDYSENNPNRLHSNEHFRTPYKVIGWEDVTVPAGTFRALKIEAEGEWSAVIAPAVSAVSGSRVDAQGSTVVMQTGRALPKAASGRTYKAFWYVPTVKRWVKSIEEYYGSNGVRNEQYVDELESFKVSS